MRAIVSLDDALRKKELYQSFEEIIASGMYAEGNSIRQAEQTVGKMYHGKAVAMNSCGSALYVMFRFYKSQGWKQVYMQNNTFFATGAMAIEAGLRIVLVDSRVDCPSMSVDSLRAAYKEWGQGVICITHVGGWLAKDHEQIAAFAEHMNCPFVEDAAHCFGAGSVMEEPGMYSEAACWSFYPTKAIPIGEGGMLTTTREDLAKFAGRFRQYGKYWENGKVAYDQGMNLRMSEWDAAILNVQIHAMQTILDARQRDAEKLQSIASCALTGPTNWYKYITKDPWEGRKAGKVYAYSDQLMQSLQSYGQVSRTVPLTNSVHWSMNHSCLPIGEGLYDSMSKTEVMNMLKEKD